MILPPVITIDGPSGSGKSVLSKSLSKYLKWFNLESGLIYRILACLFLQQNIPIKKEFLMQILNNLDFYFIYRHGLIYDIKSKNFSKKYIMSKEVTNTSSKLATIPLIRKYLIMKQRLFQKYPGLIANGRDMGTIIFPNAEIKFFLEANLKTRVKRRLIDLKKEGYNINYKTLIYQVKKRDERDKNRVYAPLKPANDAIIIDSSDITCDQVLNIAIKNIKKIII